MSAKTYTVIDTNTNIVIRYKVKGKSPSEVLNRYLAKDWVRKLVGVNLEVMSTEEFEKYEAIGLY